MIKIEFSVLGQPQTAGSKRGFYQPKLKRVIITDDNKNSRSWKEQVASSARQVYDGPLLREALSMRLVFYRVRPKGHFKSDGSFSKEGNARSTGPATRPDLLKLTRAVEDALKGIIYVDDSQIVSQTLRKRWGEPSRVDVMISEEVE
jgi:Holliday junction resolvase RusA-like endonuclease